MKTAKQLKKNQAAQEKRITLGDVIIAYWTYSDYMEDHKYFSGKVTVTDNAKDHIKATLNEELRDQHGILLYPEGFVIWIPKTNNPEWSINSRFYLNKFIINNKSIVR